MKRVDCRRLVRRWGLVLPVGWLAGVLLFVLGAWVRGTWAEAERRFPAAVGAAPVCHVCAPPGEPRHVRCAARLPHPLEEVWLVLANHDRCAELCPCVRTDGVLYEPDGRCLVEGRVDAVLGLRLPFVLEVRQEQGLDTALLAWDGPGAATPVNWGHWRLTAVGPSETLVEAALEVQVAGTPTFVLRNLSLSRLPRLMAALERRLAGGDPLPGW